MQVASTKTPENLVCKNIGENSFTVLLSSECRWPNVNEAKLCQVCQRQKFANHAASEQFCHLAKRSIYRFAQKSLEKANSQTDMRDCTKEFRNIVGWCANKYKYKYKFANHAASVQFCHSRKNG